VTPSAPAIRLPRFRARLHAIALPSKYKVNDDFLTKQSQGVGSNMQEEWYIEPVNRAGALVMKSALELSAQNSGSIPYDALIRCIAALVHPDPPSEFMAEVEIDSLALLVGRQAFRNIEAGGDLDDVFIGLLLKIGGASFSYNKQRGTPEFYSNFLAHMYGGLACFEYELLTAALSKKEDLDNFYIAKRLYWFERFIMRRREVEGRQPPHKLNSEKKKQADRWHQDFLQFHEERIRSNPNRKVTPTESAKSFPGGQQKPYKVPSEEVRVKWLTKTVRKAAVGAG
jgi:hypothetical protein